MCESDLRTLLSVGVSVKALQSARVFLQGQEKDVPLRTLERTKAFALRSHSALPIQ